MDKVDISLGFQPNLALADEGSDGLPTRFSGIAYSGGVVPGFSRFGDIAIDLSTMKLPKKALFALINHDPNQRAGKLNLSVNDGTVYVDGNFIRSESGKQVALEFADGAPWEFSVGFSGDIETFDQAKTLIVNGHEVTVNGLVMNASVREVSFVPAGADPNTSAIAFSYMKKEVVEMSVDKPIEDNHDDSQVIIDELKAKLSEMQAQIEAERSKASELQSKLNDLHKSIRSDKVSKLEVDLGVEFTEDKKTAYLEMNDTVFDLISSDLLAVKSASSKKYDMYFGEIAKSGQSATDVDLSRKLFEQVSGVK